MTGRQVYFLVHGRRAPRRSPRRRAAGRGPARNWKYRAWIRSLPCAVCGTHRFVEAAHTGSDGGKALKASDYSCIPLCVGHHRLRDDSYHALMREGFHLAHGLDVVEMVRDLNGAWFARAAEVK